MALSKVVVTTTNPDQPRDSSSNSISSSSNSSLSTLFLHLSDSDLHHTATATAAAMDDLLNSIYPNTAASSAAPSSAKIVDDVWKEIVAGNGGVAGEGITLEDFLTKAGAVREEDVRGGVATTPPPSSAAATMAQFGSSSVEAFGNGVEAAVVGASGSGGGKGKRRALEETVDKATLQKQRRMIKNRESAARSRERKQVPFQF